MQILDAEPSPVVEIGEADLPRIARAFGELADLKNPFTHGHAAACRPGYPLATANRLGLDRRTSACLEIAAYLHDVGRIGVSNRIWAKAGALTTAEWEQVHLHAYHSERVLASTSALKPRRVLSGCITSGLTAPVTTAAVGAKISMSLLASWRCADAFQAMTQRRPHRPRWSQRGRETNCSVRRAPADLTRRLSPPFSTRAIFTAVDVKPSPSGRAERPRGRGLRLVAEGCSNPEIGRRLGISRRTAEHHVQHIYDKIGVSTRAAAVLFALEHDLLCAANSARALRQ